VLNRTLAIGICRIELQISQSKLDHVAVYSSAVYVEANSTLSKVVKRRKLPVRTLLYVWSSALYVTANSTLSRVVKAASQNFVASVVYVKFCYSCRENFLLFHSSTYLRSARSSYNSSYSSISYLATSPSPIARSR